MADENFIRMKLSPDGKWWTASVPLQGQSLSVHLHQIIGDESVRTDQAVDPVTGQPIGEPVVTRIPLKDIRW